MIQRWRERRAKRKIRNAVAAINLCDQELMDEMLSTVIANIDKCSPAWLENLAGLVLANLHRCPDSTLDALKSKLTKWNAKKHVWRDQ